MESSQTCHLINKSNTLFCKCILTFDEAIISLWKKKKEEKTYKDINVILLKYRVSQKEVPHFKCLFYKNGKRYKNFRCNTRKDI